MLAFSVLPRPFQLQRLTEVAFTIRGVDFRIIQCFYADPYILRIEISRFLQS